MIKLSLRPNLIYPLFLIIWAFLRKLIAILISILFEFYSSLLFTFLMFFGEIIGGLIFYLYQIGFCDKKFKICRTCTKQKLSFVTRKAKMNRIDCLTKIVFLVFMTAFFDFFEYVLSTYYISNIRKISGSLQIRLAAFLIVTSSLVCRFSLKISLFKHQIFSLSIIGICLLILIISEFFFQKFDFYLSISNLFIAIILSLLSHSSIAFNDTIDKYLIDFNFLHPFLVLMFQGIIGLLFSIICAIFANPIPFLIMLYKNSSKGMFILFIFFIILYTIFGALKNIYRMYTIMLFSPMNKHLADIIINPLYIIFYFSIGDDFINNNKRNYFYFFLNLVLLIVVDFCGLIYNEFFILSCFGLEYNTYSSIIDRANKTYYLEDINSREESFSS